MLGQWLYAISEPVVAAIDLMALVLIAGATAYTFVVAIRMVLSGKSPTGHERRLLWLTYARWLVAGLTFELAADILETAWSGKVEAPAPDSQDDLRQASEVAE